LRGQRRRRTRAGLRHFIAHVRRNVHAAHVCVVCGLTVHARDHACRHSVSRRERQVAVARRGCVQWRCILRVVATVRATCSARCSGTRGKGSSSSGGSLFDRAGVVVLVASQCGATRERLLAVGVWALVRAFSRVNATMSREGTRVAKRLWRVSCARSAGSRAKYLATALTHVRFLAGVNALVDSQG
jgi:hypothetical protein